MPRLGLIHAGWSIDWLMPMQDQVVRGGIASAFVARDLVYAKDIPDAVKRATPKAYSLVGVQLRELCYR